MDLTPSSENYFAEQTTDRIVNPNLDESNPLRYLMFVEACNQLEHSNEVQTMEYIDNLEQEGEGQLIEDLQLHYFTK